MASLPSRPLFRPRPDNNGRVSRHRVVQRWRKTVGAVIGAAIRDSDRKQIEVAKALGISENVLSEIVQGHRKTELGEIVQIAKAINEEPLVLIRRILSWHSLDEKI
jgi:predicted XRE-type DNA-binding protein